MVKIAINLYVQKQSWTKDLSKNVSAPTEPTLLASDDELNGYNGKKCQSQKLSKTFPAPTEPPSSDDELNGYNGKQKFEQKFKSNIFSPNGASITTTGHRLLLEIRRFVLDCTQALPACSKVTKTQEKWERGKI